MIQVRDVFQVKFGAIDQAVKLFASLPELAPAYAAAEPQANVLTDVSGGMYTLVTELVLPSIGEFEVMRDRLFTLPEFGPWFKQFQQFIEDGRREYYTIEGAYEPWSRPGVIVVRETYRTFKWQIHTAVSLLQRYGALLVDRGVGRRPRVLTDASGAMFRASIEIETDSLTTWETHRREMFAEPEFHVWFVQLCSAVESGQHEFFRVEYVGGK